MIRTAEKEDLPALAALAQLLWPHHTQAQLLEEFTEIFEQGQSRFFLKFAGSQAVGFAQCQLRHDYVEGTETSPVGYLEGIFLREDFRRRGYGRQLITACEGWAREQGCREFASDCEVHNDDSFRFHMGAGFTEANRIICFVKEL